MSGKKRCFLRLLTAVEHRKAANHPINLLNEPDENGEVVLHRSVNYLNEEITNMLLDQEADYDARDNDGNSPLHLLAKRHSKKSDSWSNIADALLSMQHIDVNALNKEGKKPTDESFPSGRKLAQKINNSHDFDDETSDFYHLVLTNKSDELSEFFEENAAETGISNQYVGSENLTHHFAKLNDKHLLQKALELKCDPWRTNVNETLPLRFALEIGSASIVDTLITSMKEVKSQEYIDISENSFEYLNILLTADEESKGNHNECLERLLRDDVVLDVNSVNKDGLTPLQVAAIANNQEAMEMLIANGSFVGTKRTFKNTSEYTFIALNPNTLENAINDCVRIEKNDLFEKTDASNPEFTLELDYQFLISPANKKLKGTPEDHYSIRSKVAGTVLDIGKHSSHENCLQLPLMEALLDSKWRSIHVLIKFNALVTFLFLFLLISQCIFLNVGENQSIPFMVETHLLRVPLVVLAILLTIKEILELLTNFGSYFKRRENYIECFLNVSAIVICYVPMPQTSVVHLTAWTTLVAL